MTIQILTELEVTVEGEKVTNVAGSRRIGRVTPSSNPPDVWNISANQGNCPDGGRFPFAPGLNDGQVSASVRDETTIAISVPGGKSGVAVEWTINPTMAKTVSPDIQYGKPERFNGYWCAEISLPLTRWSFTRRRNSTTTTEDIFDHFQTFRVRQETTATAKAPISTSVQPPSPRYFKGDSMP